MGRLLLILCFGFTLNCDDTQTVVSQSDAGLNTDSSVFETNDVGQVLCGSEPCACSDQQDNDGDGLADGFDPECTGPYDDDEETFATGIPGDNRDPKWQDCFFDGNSGAGDDRCRYSTECLTGEKAADDADCIVSEECTDFCRPRTPNGCDCFGCCELQTSQGSIWATLDEGCSASDPSNCETCIPTELCRNGCGMCEVCIGQPESELPESCFENEQQPACDDGETQCEQNSDCPLEFHCQFGCCLRVAL